MNWFARYLDRWRSNIIFLSWNSRRSIWSSINTNRSCPTWNCISGPQSQIISLITSATTKTCSKILYPSMWLTSLISNPRFSSNLQHGDNNFLLLLFGHGFKNGLIPSIIQLPFLIFNSKYIIKLVHHVLL